MNYWGRCRAVHAGDEVAWCMHGPYRCERVESRVVKTMSKMIWHELVGLAVEDVEGGYARR
jgi:hypothetical protein